MVSGSPVPRASACPVSSARIQPAASPPVCLRPSWSPGSGATPAPYVSCRADGGGGGLLRVGGPGNAVGGALGCRTALPPPCRMGSEAPCMRSCRASGHRRRGWLSIAPLFAWGLGLRRWRVPRAVAPLAEGGAQGPGQPDFGLRVRDAEHCPPFQEGWPLQPPVGPSHPNHGPEDPFVVLPGHPAPRGYFPGSTRPSEGARP